jgi:hypothetical protein
MVNSIAVSAGDFNGPARDWVFPPVDYTGDDEGITDRQKNMLTQLVILHTEGEERERWLSQIEELDRESAESHIFSFLSGTWK